jgi:hypothetical protein
MDTNFYAIATIDGRKAIGVPCIDWQVDEPVKVPIRRKPLVILPPPREVAGIHLDWRQPGVFARRFERSI